MFATRRRNRRSATMKQELGQSVDHFKRAATLAAQETSATVGPKFSAAKDRVQPVAAKAKDSASTGWESAVATLTPLVTAATENVRQTSKKSAKISRRTAKANQKSAKKLEKQANRAVGRKRAGRRTGWLLIAGAAVGAGAAYAARKRKAQQWDEYDPSPVTTTPVVDPAVDGVEDAAFEPIENTKIEPVNIKKD